MMIPLIASLLVATSFAVGVVLGNVEVRARYRRKWKRPHAKNGKFQRKEPTC